MQFYFALPKICWTEILHIIFLWKFQINESFNKLHLIIHQILTFAKIRIFIEKCTAKSYTQPVIDVSERSQSDLLWERCLREVLETSHKICLFATSLRSLKYFSVKMPFIWRPWDVSKTSLKRCLLCDVFKTSLAYPKKYVFPVTSPRRLKAISWKYSWFLKNTPQK